MSTPPQRRLRVLVVDDNLDALESIAILLQLRGYAVDIASNGSEALRHIRAKDYDAAILDIGMPGINGYELAELARIERPGLHLIAFTAYNSPEHIEAAKAAGFNSHVVKGTSLAPLYSTLTDISKDHF